MMKNQRGAAAIELALLFLIFSMFLFGITDFARLLFAWGAASEATRHGARFAAICDDTHNAAKVLARMRGLVPEIGAINIAWSPAGCDATNCQSVTVTITSLNFHWLSPITGVAQLPIVAMPTFATTVPRENMKTLDNVAAYHACT